MSKSSAAAYASYDENRHARRDGVLMYPERVTGDRYRPGAMAVEVEAALSRPPRSKCTTVKAARAPWPVNLGEPPTMNGRKLTYASAGVMLGISAPAMYKRVSRHGWTKALAMGDAHGHSVNKQTLN
jgi:hypothetical protein